MTTAKDLHYYPNVIDYGRDGIAIITKDPLSDDEVQAIHDFIVSLRPKPPAQHLPGCTEPTEETVEDAAPHVGPTGLLEQNAWTTFKGGCLDGCPVRRELERARTRPTTGKWTCSTDEEHWTCSESFDTEADAIEYGKVHSEEQGIEDGDTYYTGQIVAMTPEEIARADASSVIERIDEYIYENFSDECGTEFKATAEQEADLDERLKRTVTQWLVHHDLTPHTFTIHKVKSHRFEQCEERDTSKNDPAHHPRCIRHKGHPMPPDDDEGHDFEDDRCTSPDCAPCRRRWP